MFEYGVLEFTSKARVQGKGIMFTPLLQSQVIEGGSKKRVVQCKTDQVQDMWAKVKGTELVEISGPVGDFETEARVIRQHFGVLPCKYPTTETGAEECMDKADRTHVPNAITVDGPHTLDRDDAISFQCLDDGSIMLGVHITDVTSLSKSMVGWAKQRGASAYWCDANEKQNTKPMLPPKLAHYDYSLNKGLTHPCLSLFIILGEDGRRTLSHSYTTVHITDNITYDDFAQQDVYVSIRKVLAEKAGVLEYEADKMIAWLMIEYNLYFAKLLADTMKTGGLLRVQDKEGDAASYMLIGSAIQPRGHATMDGKLYGHFTSPIRRFADLHNQMVLKGCEEACNINEEAITGLNKRMTQLQQFHYHSTVMELAYKYKKEAGIFMADIELTEDGRSILVHLPDRRVRIPLHDSYYTEPISNFIKTCGCEKGHRIELFGIHKRGRAELRVRLLDKPVEDIVDFKSQRGGVEIERKALPPPLIAGTFDSMFESALTRLEMVLGYPLDEFQQKALGVMLRRDDLLGMAPTGSGKTVLALMAILLLAFDVKGRAILTSPIKALSNQKYAEFSNWLKKITPHKRITLLTGDIQARATAPGGDGEGELLIMTSEILSNKLISSKRSGVMDPDLIGVTVVIMDEVHYINDPSRGYVWENSIMTLPAHIQLVALSATLSDPQRFAQWMSRRRPDHPSVVVQRHDRHVPLHFGCYDDTGTFVEMYSTHATNKTFNTSTYEAIHRGGRERGGNFQQTVNKLVTTLEKDDKLPVIVFLMNRNRCQSAATSITRNLLTGYRVPPRRKDQDEYDYQWLVEQHMEKVVDVRRRQDSLFMQHLLPYKNVLDTLPGFADFKNLIDRGVGYHHAGMLPILREYVELLFQERLLKVVFATETLGVGINMPARTVVFTQIDKPCGQDATRTLRTDEFWQMAGRSGRRGMDERGFVVYYPLDQHTAAVMELRQLLIGQMPAVSSQLRVDAMFVLKNINRYETPDDVMAKTLLQHEHDRRSTVLKLQLEELVKGRTEGGGEDERNYISIQSRLQLKGFIKLTASQRKTMETDMVLLKNKYGDGELESLVKKEQQRIVLEKDIDYVENALPNEWNRSFDWLVRHGYIADLDEVTLTRKGRACADMSDGDPLVRSKVLCDDLLDNMDFEDIVSHLACFSESIRMKTGSPELPYMSDAFKQAYAAAADFAEECNTTIKWSSGALMCLWCQTKDIRVISQYVDHAQLGVFVKMILRVICFIDELKQILLGLEKFELYNKLDGHHDKLLDGIVTNLSLYVSAYS